MFKKNKISLQEIKKIKIQTKFNNKNNTKVKFKKVKTKMQIKFKTYKNSLNWQNCKSIK